MTKMKRYSSLALCLLLVFSLMLTGCNGGKGSDPALSADATYKVTVVDGVGNAYTEKLIVKIMQNGKQVTMGAINADGTFEKVLPRGDYEVQVASTNSELECHYKAEKLTAEITEVKVVMAYAPTATNSISANSVATGEYMSYEAAVVSAGSSYIELTADDRTYALFTPTQPGTYKFTVSNDDATIGYYGSPYFVQGSNVAENVDGNSFTMSIDAGMIGEAGSGTTMLVIGLDAKDGVEGCILNIERTGDPAWSIDAEPWTQYQGKVEVKDFTLESGVELIPFDITADTNAYQLFLNEEDGTYHLGAANGPKVYVNVGEAVYGICMKDMVGEIVYDSEGVLIATGTAPFRYMYSNGKQDFFKEDYTDFMRRVVTAADKATGVYPLTEDLYYALPLGYENMGWCKEGTANYLFNGVDVNPEIAWMFMLCYADGEIPEYKPDDSNNGGNNGGTTTPPNGPVEDNKDEPIEIGSTLEFTADVKANHIVCFNVFRVNDTTLTIKNKDAYVIYNGVRFDAVNGVVTVPGLYSQYTNIPVAIQIGNKGTTDASFDVILTYPVGHRENPIELPMKSFSTDVKKNNEQGVYYSFTPAQAGTLTLTLDSVTSKSGTVKGAIVVTVSGADLIPYQYVLDGESNTLTVPVNAGDSVVITIGVLPNEQNKYLAATVNVTASFA